MGPQSSAKAKAKAKSAEAEAAAVAAQILAPKPGAPVEAKEEVPSSSVDIKVPEKSIGVVIGPKGKNIKLIQEKTGVTRIDTNDQIFTITGPPEAVMQAKNAVEELITKGYTAIMFEGFKEDKVAAYPNSFPDIIGSGGKIVRKIKEELNVEVSLPEVPKNSGDKKKYDIKVAGKKDDVDKAVECINSILTYYHHPITHPDMIHQEMEVEQWAYAFIIGKGGSELRHIQNNFKVQVKIPRPPFSVSPNVIVVGEKDNVERAIRSMEKTIWDSSNRSGGRGAADKAEDYWGEEGEMEEWEKAYMYKRA
jgi:polyribonucleotide nucleotidyltransferase